MTLRERTEDYIPRVGGRGGPPGFLRQRGWHLLPWDGRRLVSMSDTAATNEMISRGQ